MSSSATPHPSSDPQTSSPDWVAEVDRDLTLLAEHKRAWVETALSKKIQFLEEVLRGVGRVAEAQVEASCQAKGLSKGSSRRGEEWLGGPMVQARIIRQMVSAFKSIEARGHTGLKDADAYTLPSGQVSVKVFPKGIDHVTFPGFKAEVRLQPHVRLNEWRRYSASLYRSEGAERADQKSHEGALSLVLGAGNVSSIGLLDVLHKLYVEGQVCFLKFNPVNGYLEDAYAEILKPLIDAGFIRMRNGDGELGAYLCQHELVEEIHITGSDRTHDAIIYGVGEEGARRKAEDDPVCDKRITSELGNVSPIIVVPGAWSHKELVFHAENLATQMTNNAGFNCNAARVIITHRDWPQRRAFLDALRRVLSLLPGRPAYYPGAHDRFETFMDAADGKGERIGGSMESSESSEGASALPWGLISDVDPNDQEHTCFRSEAFCGLVAETALEASDTSDFIKSATTFANETLWGTLSSSIIIDTRTQRAHQEELDEAVNTLKYGTVCVNHWPALAYGMGVTSWGAYPGHTRQDIQSGVGVVHNTFMLESVEKTVIHGPFVVKPRPPWFVTHRRAESVGRALTSFELTGSLLHIPRLIWAAMRG